MKRCRAEYRASYFPETRNNSRGLRVAMELPAAEKPGG
jgi:hypothetical protein